MRSSILGVVVSTIILTSCGSDDDTRLSSEATSVAVESESISSESAVIEVGFPFLPGNSGLELVNFTDNDLLFNGGVAPQLTKVVAGESMPSEGSFDSTVQPDFWEASWSSATRELAACDNLVSSVIDRIGPPEGSSFHDSPDGYYYTGVEAYWWFEQGYMLAIGRDLIDDDRPCDYIDYRFTAQDRPAPLNRDPMDFRVTGSSFSDFGHLTLSVTATNQTDTDISTAFCQVEILKNGERIGFDFTVFLSRVGPIYPGNSIEQSILFPYVETLDGADIEFLCDWAEQNS